MPAKILLTGEGGQGVQVASKIIAKAGQQAQRHVSYLPSFGVEQRGGVSIGFVQIGHTQIRYPRFNKADFIIAFSNRSIDIVKEYITDKTVFIFDSSLISDKNVQKLKNVVHSYIAIPADQIAREKFGERSANMVILGAISAQLKEIPYSIFENVINREFAKKIENKPELKESNINAFKYGIEYAEKFDFNKIKFAGSEDKDIIRNFENEKNLWHRFPEYCKGCSLCVIRCPVKALKLSNDTNYLGTQMPIVDMEKCIGCEKCMHICPDGAIRVEKK